MNDKHIANIINKDIRELNDKISKAHDLLSMMDAFMEFVEEMDTLAKRIEAGENS